jgi:hypothetical protein
MNKPIYLFSAVLLFCAFFVQNARAQTTVSDSSSQQNALNNAIALYNTGIDIQAPIYTGPEYYFYDPHIKGNAYYMDINGFTKGSVYYDGTLYNNVSMLYDINTDQLVVLYPSRVSKFIAIKERVKSFDFLGGHFININADTLAANGDVKSGYYRQLYNGRSEVLGKYSKSMQTTTSNTNGVENYFSFSKDFYIKKNNVYHSVGSKGSVLDLFKDKKKEVRKFISANDLDFRGNPEESLVKVATYYDHLSN